MSNVYTLAPKYKKSLHDVTPVSGRCPHMVQIITKTMTMSSAKCAGTEDTNRGPLDFCSASSVSTLTSQFFFFLATQEYQKSSYVKTITNILTL